MPESDSVAKDHVGMKETSEKALLRISLIGTGLMGRPMAERLREVGYRVTVFNRTRAKAEPLRALDVTIAETPDEAIQASPWTILMLTDYPAIDEVVFRHGRPSALRDKTIVQMGTIRPEESRALCRRVQEAGGRYLEAPVLGSKAEARAGTLIVMVGGMEPDDPCGRLVFSSLGSEIVHVGSVGKAAALKLALNQLIASHMAAFSLGLAMVQRSEIDVELFMRVLRNSALMAPMFEKKLPRLLARDYTDPNFPTVHLLKDVRLARGVAETLQLDHRVLEAIEELLTEAVSRSFGEKDYSAMFEIVPRDLAEHAPDSRDPARSACPPHGS